MMRHFVAGIAFWFFSTSVFAAEVIDFAALYEAHSKSVVTIHTAGVALENGSPRRAQGVGSGVLIEKDQILTAAHVVENSQVVEVIFKDGERISAQIIASVEASDVALLKLKRTPRDPHVAVLADSDKTRVGSQVFIIGSPFGISQTLSVGHLSGRLNRGLMAGGTPIEFMQTDSAINTGNSGGPMFNTRGEVIGIVSFILSKGGGFDGIGFATSSNTAKQALLRSSGILAGFEGILLTDEVAKLLNFPGAGLLVQRVVDESVIGKAGLIAGTVPANVAGQSMLLGGDLILDINGIVCRTPHDFELVRASTLELQEEETYTVTIFRDGKTVELIAGAPLSGFGLAGTH